MKGFFKTIKKRDIIVFLIASVAFIVLDQYTKYLTVKNLNLGESANFIKGLLDFTYIRNEGASFGMLQGRQLFFIIITIILLPVITYFYLKISSVINTNKDNVRTSYFIWLKISVILIFSGAVGNFIDRVRLNYVIDFLDVKFMDFPIFNVADCYVTVGVVILFLLIILMKEQEIDYIFKIRKKNIENV